MKLTGIQSVGMDYASENYADFYQVGMDAEQFAASAFESYNKLRRAHDIPRLPDTLKPDFLTGVRMFFMSDKSIEISIEILSKKGWIVLIYKNSIGWVAQLQDGKTGRIVTEQTQTVLQELLFDLSQYRSSI